MHMRLVDVNTLRIHNGSSDQEPSYVIASHRWQDDEVTYKDVQEGKSEHKTGYHKLLGFASFIKQHTPEYQQLWIDTCCIDKRDKSELEYSINSMFQWYRDSNICLAYLHDVYSLVDETELRNSDWFKRGWTLQELLAPKLVVFLDAAWHIIGYKGSPMDSSVWGHCLNDIISRTTGIPPDVLADYSNAERLSLTIRLDWAKHRETTLPEDKAYCLVGLLDVDIRIAYGGMNAGRKAMDRLLSKLHKTGRGTAQPATTFRQDLTHMETSDTNTELARFTQLARCLDRLDIYLMSSRASHFQATWPYAREVRALCGSLARQMHGLVHLQRRGVLDMSLLLACIKTCVFGNVDIDMLFQRLLLGAEQLCTSLDMSDPKVTCLSLFQDLETTNVLLKFALDAYYDAKQANRSEMSQHSLSSSITTPLLEGHAGKCSSDVSVAYGRRHGSVESRRCNGSSARRQRSSNKLFAISIDLSWLSRTVWDFAVLRAGRGWQLHLMPSSCVAMQAPVLKYCRTGNIEGMKNLIETGQASLRDRNEEGEDTLTIALQHGQVNIIEYILSRTDWSNDQIQCPGPNFTMHMHQQDEALFMEQIYKLFIEYDSLSIDLGEPSSNDFHWWTNSPSNACRNLLMNNAFGDWATLSIEKRFQLIVQAAYISAAEFRQLINLSADDPAIGEVEDEKEGKVIHFVAGRLASAVVNWDELIHQESLSMDPEVQAWSELCVSVLRVTPDPHTTRADSSTAFTVFLQECVSGCEAIHRLHEVLQLWRCIVIRAGYNVDEYIKAEQKHLLARRVGDLQPFNEEDPQCIVADISVHRTNGQWTLKLAYSTPIEVRQLLPYPGSYNALSDSLPTIFWRPHGQELEEGHWTTTRRLTTIPRYVWTNTKMVHEHDAITDIINGAQDEAGMVMMLRKRSTRRGRSNSSPPALWRRPGAYLANHSYGLRSNLVTGYHLCPRTGLYGACWSAADAVHMAPSEQLLGCMNPSTVSYRGWRYTGHTFLGEMNRCQSGHWLANRTCYGVRHTFAPDCPHGCGRVAKQTVSRLLHRWRSHGHD